VRPARDDETAIVPTPEGTLPSSPTPPSGEGYPQGTHIGVAAVDQFLDLVYAADSIAIADKARFRDFRCSRTPSAGSLECAPSMPEGALRTALPTGTCALSFVLDRQALRRQLDDDWSRGATSLYGVYDGGDESEARYTVVLTYPDGVHRFYYLDDSGRLIRIAACGPSPAGASPILPPRN